MAAHITMNSKSIGADMVFATEGSEIGPMEADLAAQIIYADEIEAAADKSSVRSAKSKEVKACLLAAANAAKRGYVDAIVDEASIRKQLIYSFEMLYTKREDRPVKKHGTV